MSRTQNSVSRLLISVGQPNSPTWKGQAAFALEAFQQRGFLAADVSAGAASQMHRRAARRQLCNFNRQQLVRGGIFVAQIDIDVRRIDDVGRNQGSLEKAMRVTEQVEAVLECPGFTLVGIDDHHPRSRLSQHRAPFAPGRKTGAAKPAQAGIVKRLEDVLLADAARAQIAKQLVAAISHIGVVVDIGWNQRISFAARCGGEDFGCGRAQNVAMTDFGNRCAVAEADAGRTHDPDRGTALVLQFLQQFFGAEHRAGQRIADADGERRDVGLALLHDVEMRIKGRGLEHLGKGELHLVGKGGEMSRGDLMIFVLDQVQVFDQKVAPTRPVAQEQFDLVRCGGIDLAALGRRFRPLSPLPRMFKGANLMHVTCHELLSRSPPRQT